jgi:lipid II:glycine glycyltransferase (peptidoglycan interpeptide bridge formation enzyme)
MSSEISLVPVADAKAWDAWCSAEHAHILQTFAWGELKRQFGWQVERLAWRVGEKIHAGAQVLYRALAPGLTIAYVPRGPVGSDAASLAQFFAPLHRHVRARGAFLLKLEPDWQRADARVEILRATHAQPTAETIQPPATLHLDLTADLDTILARMKPKWRYNIRLAAKKNVVVRAGTLADCDAFYELMRVTSARDHFAIHGKAYYRTAFELFDARGLARLFVAEYERQPLAMIFVTAFAHEAIYLYGASGNAERNRMPNHALHWAAIQWAKAHGCAHYDLWGIPDDTPADDAPASLPDSLSQFKQGFGGERVRYTGAWDVVYDPLRYRAYKLARRIRARGLG